MAPRGHKTAKPSLPGKTLVVDNGAYSIKAGFVTEAPNVEQDCHTIANCLGKTARNQVLVGSEVDGWSDFAEMTFRRPIQKGNLVSWEAEKQIWDHEFFDSGALLHCDPHETNLLLGDGPNSLTALASNCDQMVFEEFEFAAYRRCVGPSLNAFNDISSIYGDRTAASPGTGPMPMEALLVIDSGYSHTTITPLYHGRPIQQALQRLDIGGKFLTNYLKDVLSIRQLDVRAEMYAIDRLKEEACFVSRDFRADLDKVKNEPTKSGIVQGYVLPNYTTRTRGELRPHSPLDWKQMSTLGYVTNADGERDALIKIGNERFTMPELFFNPKDVGLNQPGLAELVMKSLSKVPTGLWTAMLANVYVVGGNSLFPGFVNRLYDELRPLAPAECMVRVASALDPIKSNWLGGAKLCADPASLKEVMVTRQDYQERGSAWLQSKFSGSALS